MRNPTMKTVALFTVMFGATLAWGQTPCPEGDWSCLPEFDGTVAVISHHYPCGVDVTLVGEAFFDSVVYVGFYNGCYGYTGLPIAFTPSGPFNLTLTLECGQTPLWDPNGECVDASYTCYEELSVWASADSCRWYEGWCAGSQCSAPAMELVSDISSYGLAAENLYLMDELVAQCSFTETDTTAAEVNCESGTFWDEQTQTCLPTSLGDLNADGCVGCADLLALLTAYGLCE